MGGTSGKELQELEKCPTGIQGLDEVTFGGLPRGRPTLVTGAAGSGNVARTHKGNHSQGNRREPGMKEDLRGGGTETL